MNILRALVLTALSAAAVSAADVVPAFNATLTVGKESRFVLLNGDGKSSSWLKVGDTFAGYTVKAYDPKAAALDLEKDGVVTRVSLAADAKVAPGAADMTPATVADATAMLDAMHFETMLDRTLAAVRKQQSAMLDRMIPPSAQLGVDRDAMLAHQKKMVDLMMSAFNGAELKPDMAKAYSEVFTKQELQGLSDFYASPLGETFTDKQPKLAEKMNQVIVPRMMAMMPKVQQMTRDFMAEQSAKKAAAAVGGAAPAPANLPAAPTASPTPAPTGKE